MNFKLSNEISTVSEVVDQWLKIRAEFVSCLNSISEAFFSKVPDNSHWSISHLSEHVYLSQWNAVRPIPLVLAQKLGEVIPSNYSINYSFIREQFQKPTGVKNPDSVTPQHSYSKEEILSLLKKSEEKLLSVTSQKEKSELVKRGIPHPVFGLLHSFDWLWVMSLHEYSHLVGLKNRIKDNT